MHRITIGRGAIAGPAQVLVNLDGVGGFAYHLNTGVTYESSEPITKAKCRTHSIIVSLALA